MIFRQRGKNKRVVPRPRGNSQPVSFCARRAGKTPSGRETLKNSGYNTNQLIYSLPQKTLGLVYKALFYVDKFCMLYLCDFTAALCQKSFTFFFNSNALFISNIILRFFVNQQSLGMVQVPTNNRQAIVITMYLLIKKRQIT